MIAGPGRTFVRPAEDLYMFLEMPLKDALRRFPRLAEHLPLGEIDLTLPYIFRLSHDQEQGKLIMEVGLPQDKWYSR